MLGAATWPRLRSLTIRGEPGIFELIRIDSMPSLTELRVSGSLTAADADALRRSAHFCSTIEVLCLPGAPGQGTTEAVDYFNAVGGLLTGLHRLRHLKVIESEDLGFVAGAELPNLEYLDVTFFSERGILPFVSKLHPSLSTMNLYGFDMSPGGLEPLVSNLSTSFPALKSLSLHSGSNFEFVREMRHPNLKSLRFEGDLLEATDVAAIAAALTHLNALEALEINVDEYKDDEYQGVHEEEAYDILFSHPPLARLRRLETGYGWEDTDESLASLIATADKVPNLEEIVMRYGHISADGFAALAVATMAGRAGRWPRLKRFQIREFDGDDEENCRRLLQEVWTGLQLKIGSD